MVVHVTKGQDRVRDTLHKVELRATFSSLFLLAAMIRPQELWHITESWLRTLSNRPGLCVVIAIPSNRWIHQPYEVENPKRRSDVLSVPLDPNPNTQCSQAACRPEAGKGGRHLPN